MSGPGGSVWRRFVAALYIAVLAAAGWSESARAQQRREREPNAVYAERRAKLAAQAEGPVVLWGYTGREEFSSNSVFGQENNFYYLTGHNEEGAGLILLPAARKQGWDGPAEILFLPEKNTAKEKWNGARVSPTDPDITSRTGFAAVKVFAEMRSEVERLAKVYPSFDTVLPYKYENGGYPHEKDVTEWLQSVVPQAKLRDIRLQIEALRRVKSAGELAFLQKAIDLSGDAHVAAMKMMRPGLFEYQIAAKMAEVHAMGGSETEGYMPIVGAGPNSTALHYDNLGRKIEDGDIVVLDVGAQYSGYSADITRTIPANGKFTARQRAIYEIVLGAQNAAMEKLKPGMSLCKTGKDSVYKISYDYINAHGKDLHGKPLGQYFIHGLGHHIGLDVHDPEDDYCRPLQPGNIVTMEPGIYIPEENLGVRIEDDVLITENGNKLLSAKLPRDPDQIEKIMAEEAHTPAANGTGSDADQIKSLVAKYAKSVDGADTALAAEVWSDSPDTSFINPLGHEHGWEEVKRDVYERAMGGRFSERKLSVRDLSVHVYGEAAWAEFSWHFVAKLKSDSSAVTADGRETQVYQKTGDKGWRLVHVHYSALPPAK